MIQVFGGETDFANVKIPEMASAGPKAKHFTKAGTNVFARWSPR